MQYLQHLGARKFQVAWHLQHLRLLLICCWFVSGLLFICCWFVSGLLLVCCWFVVDVLLIYCWSVVDFLLIFPQQHKLMGSSAQNTCTGARWCRRRVKFNEVLEKVPKVPEKVWEALVQEPGQVFQRRFRRRSGRLWCRARSGSTGFRRRFRRRFLEALVTSPSQVQQGSGESSEGSGGSGSTGFRRRLWRKLQRRSGRLRCRAGSGSTGFRKRFRRFRSRSGRL